MPLPVEVTTESVNTILNGPYVLVATQALKDIAQKSLVRWPRLSALIMRYVIPAIPLIAGAAYGYVIADPGQAAENAMAGAQAGLAASGAFRTWQVIVRGK